MNWLTEFVLPKIRAAVTRREVPDNLWTKCPACGQMLFHRELEKNFEVCHACGHHMRIGADRRMRVLFDEGEFTPIELPKPPTDPLRFRDRKRYADRLKEPGGRPDAIQVAHGRIGGHAAVAAVFEFGFMGGSMGMAVGEAIVAAARLAVLQKAALIVVPASGGARMQEGLLSLMQMPRTTIAVDEVKEAGLPYIVILTDPTTGGVTASFAMLGDVTIAEPGALLAFTGPRVVQSIIKEKLPDDFGRSEQNLRFGQIDAIVPRPEQRSYLARLLRLFAR